MRTVQIITIIYGILCAVNSAASLLGALFQSALDKGGFASSSSDFFDTGEFSAQLNKSSLVLMPFMLFIGLSYYYGASMLFKDFAKAKSILLGSAVLSVVWYIGWGYKMQEVFKSFPEIPYLGESFSSALSGVFIFAGGFWYCGFAIFVISYIRRVKPKE